MNRASQFLLPRIFTLGLLRVLEKELFSMLSSAKIAEKAEALMFMKTKAERYY